MVKETGSNRRCSLRAYVMSKTGLRLSKSVIARVTTTSRAPLPQLLALPVAAFPPPPPAPPPKTAPLAPSPTPPGPLSAKSVRPFGSCEQLYHELSSPAALSSMTHGDESTRHVAFTSDEPLMASPDLFRGISSCSNDTAGRGKMFDKIA